MATPRFRDLTPLEAAAVVDAFLGNADGVEFTEKFAGQHLTAEVSPDGTVQYAVKSYGKLGRGGYFPPIENALENHHPAVSSPVTYSFEVLRKGKRPDFIDYPLKSDFTAVEYTGKMTPDVADSLNGGQDAVRFMTKSDIRKDVSGVVTDPATRSRLQDFKAAAEAGRPSPQHTAEIEGILMDLVDSGRVPSSLGGRSMEGLFGTASGRGFKVPSKAYADLQRDQAKFYAVVKSRRVRDAVNRFSTSASDPSSDRLVTDLLTHVDKMSSTRVPPGFRTFFTREEYGALKKMADEYRAGSAPAGRNLATTFFRRVQDKEKWATSDVQETRRINDSNRQLSHKSRFVRLIREYVRRHLGDK